MAASNEITIYDAAVWLARMAAADGVVTPRESKILQKFASKYRIDINMVQSMAENLAEERSPEVVPLGEEYIRGYEFEKFIVSQICTNSQSSPFSVISWRGDKEADGIFAKDDSKPDLLVRCCKFSPTKNFYIECKFRSSIMPLANFDRGQISRYADIAKADRMLAFMAVGLGGTPNAPQLIYIAPLWEWLKRKPDFERFRVDGEPVADAMYRVISDHIRELDNIKDKQNKR